MVLEAREESCKANSEHPSGFLSMRAYSELQAVTYPMERLVFAGNEWSGMVPVFGGERGEEVFGIEVAVMRSLQRGGMSSEKQVKKRRKDKREVGVVLHRTEFDRCVVSGGESREASTEVNVKKLLGVETAEDEDQSVELYEAPLNLVKRGQRLETEVVGLCGMDLKAVIVTS